MRAAALTFCAALLAGCGGGEVVLPTPTAAPSFDRVIVPGQRMGPVSLGMSGAQLLQALGSPVESHSSFSDGTWNRFSNGLSAFVRHSDTRVSMIVTGEDGYATAQGAGIGSSELEIRTRLGTPVTAVNRDAGRVVCYRGMHFLLNFQTGRAYSVGVDLHDRC